MGSRYLVKIRAALSVIKGMADSMVTSGWPNWPTLCCYKDEQKSVPFDSENIDSNRSSCFSSRPPPPHLSRVYCTVNKCIIEDCLWF